MNSNPMLDAARGYLTAGLSVIPVRPGGSKAPAGPWSEFAERRPGNAQIEAWWGAHPERGIAIVGGAVSGGLELTELEGRAMGDVPSLAQLAADSGLGDLWSCLMCGWLEQSPSGGLHIRYRILDHDVPGNERIARSREGRVLAETRGRHGYAIASPTTGACHRTGRPWKRLAGGPDSVPAIPWADRQAFHALLATLDRTPSATRGPHRARTETKASRAVGPTPGDDFETKTDWADILVPHGWTLASDRGGGRRDWTRPGKEARDGISATTGRDPKRDRLYVFSSSTPFEPQRSYTKMGALAVLEHSGDYSAVARALAARGFGAGAAVPPATSAFVRATGSERFSDAVAARASSDTRPPLDSDPTERSLTDDGNALRLVDSHREVIRYVPERGQWIAWQGHQWAWSQGAVIELARRTARGLPAEDRNAVRHKRASLSAHGIEAMVRLARSDERVTVPLAQLDADPWQLNTPGGVVDIRTASVRAPDPAALHTRSTAVAPDFDAKHPMWDRFLSDTFGGDPDMIDYVQRLLGVTLIGEPLEQCFLFAYGSGANGKTTLLTVIQHLLGIGDLGYSISAPASLLLDTSTEGHPTEIARLAGARLVVTSELDDGRRFSEAKIKLLTGKDTITGRFMRQDFFSFTPTHTLWLLGNFQPEVRAGGEAFWRRVRMLAFEHTVPEATRVPDLEDQLVAQEGPAILAWAIRGAVDYAAGGLPTPESARAATIAYRTDQDTVGRFVEERCALGDPEAQHMHVRVAEVRQAYEAWCRSEDEIPCSAKALTQALRGRFGVQSRRSMDARFYSGIRLRDAGCDCGPTGAEAGELRVEARRSQ